MQSNLILAFITVFLSAQAGAEPLSVVMHDGDAHVTATALEREAGIVIKKLPGRAGFVACGAERCAPLKSAVSEEEALLVPVAALSEALNLSANFDDSRQHVILTPVPGASPSSAGRARVGSIVPNLRLTKLDGTSVSLDELRGKRVLINSWASW